MQSLGEAYVSYGASLWPIAATMIALDTAGREAAPYSRGRIEVLVQRLAGLPAFFRLMFAGARSGLDGCVRSKAALYITRQMSGCGNPDTKRGRLNV